MFLMVIVQNMVNRLRVCHNDTPSLTYEKPRLKRQANLFGTLFGVHKSIL